MKYKKRKEGGEREIERMEGEERLVMEVKNKEERKERREDRRFRRLEVRKREEWRKRRRRMAIDSTSELSLYP
ncbi:hypothetical protein [Nonomuraea dietziae]|uniref:hypothetical protein n=1 Tax=Nonomuraea dietziae TaxID=65515 RepID=UPI0031D3EE94